MVRIRLELPLLFLSFLALCGACDGPSEPMSDPGTHVVEISSSYHDCALTARGAVFCWGNNSYGQAGADTAVDVVARILLPGKARAVVTGTMFSCSLDTDGRGWCWGLNEQGQLGIGSPGHGPTGRWSVAVPESLATTIRFAALTAGAEHACGLSTAGFAYCWGKNRYGQAGGPQSPAPQPPAPFEVPGHIEFVQISAGGYFNCGLAKSGGVYCWGSYYSASGWEIFKNTPTLVSHSPTLRSIDSGGDHICGITFDDRAYCWGGGGYWGALGTDSNAIQLRSEPAAVMGNYRFSSVTAGDGYTCGIRTDRHAMCWGDNRSVQLGNGGQGDFSFVPVDVVGGHEFISLSTGGAHTCGVTTVGEVYCWGRLSWGRRADTIGVTYAAAPIRIETPSW